MNNQSLLLLNLVIFACELITSMIFGVESLILTVLPKNLFILWVLVNASSNLFSTSSIFLFIIIFSFKNFWVIGFTGTVGLNLEGTRLKDLRLLSLKKSSFSITIGGSPNLEGFLILCRIWLSIRVSIVFFFSWGFLSDWRSI